MITFLPAQNVKVKLRLVKKEIDEENSDQSFVVDVKAAGRQLGQFP